MIANPPAVADIEDARKRIDGYILRTPLLESHDLNRLARGRILIKAESLQRTGSFKFRGAWNRISRLGPESAKGGVVAYSSGNHAQGVAAAAALKGIPALIVMPADTPPIKVANTRSYGAEIVTYDRATQSREEIATRLAGERRAVIVPPFEDAHIIAGQGTVGLEVSEQVEALGAKLDILLVAASGGGLAAGIALALEARSPSTQIYVVEPAGFDDYGRSLRVGERQRNRQASGSICDALLSLEPGELTFSINRGRLAGGLAVSDAEVRHAVRYAFERLKLVIEPGGAVGLAAVLAGKIETEGRTVAVVASGGNADNRLFADIITEGQAVSAAI
jgi:threonine dehydratase